MLDVTWRTFNSEHFLVFINNFYLKEQFFLPGFYKESARFSFICFCKQYSATMLIKLQHNLAFIVARISDQKRLCKSILYMFIAKVYTLSSGRNKREREETEGQQQQQTFVAQWLNCIFNLEQVIIVLPNLHCFCWSTSNYLRRENMIVHFDLLFISSIFLSFYNFEKSRKICYLY